VSGQKVQRAPSALGKHGRDNDMSAPDKWHFDRQLRHQLKRDMLLKVAAQCFNEKGTSGTSLKDVARQLGSPTPRSIIM
jgi:AcrR family transcriptional regulator